MMVETKPQRVLMLIDKDWSILRVTLLLYLLVLLFPLNIYLANNMLVDTQLDTATINDLKRASGSMQDLILPDVKAKQESIQIVDQLLEKINTEYMQNRSNQFDVGFDNAQVEFGMFKGCWEHFKSELQQKSETTRLLEENAACQKRVMKLIVIVDKMSNIKQERALLWLNIALIATMIVMVTTIYLVRVSMKARLARHTIYDLETRLFNRDYFDAEIKKAGALALRKQHPLALIAVAIDNYETTIEPMSEKEYAALIKMFGGLLLSMTRTSDTSCRYDKDEFMIITPETNLKNAELVAQRIHKRVIEHDFQVKHPLTVSISVGLLHEYEEVPKLVDRTIHTLKEAKKNGNAIVMAEVNR
jgi:diguanylate cyclase (GGDEF)-like protein